jgi:hypothetical protein
MAKDIRAGASHELAIEGLVAKRRRSLFLLGLCWGALLTFLYAIRDYDTLVFACAIEVVWTACFGWPWER